MTFTEDEVRDALPKQGFLHEYVAYAYECTDAHLSYHIPGALTALAQSCPVDLAFPFGTPMPSHLYGLCVGKSGSCRKSAAIGIARDIIDAAIPGAIGEVPGSKENLIDSLRNKPRQLILYPEFGSFLAQTEKGYLNPLKTTYTEAWDGTPLGRGLVKKVDTEAKFPRLSLFVGSTLDYLERHTEIADWTGGFMARFLTFYAERQRSYSVPPGAPLVRDRVVQHLANLSTYAQYGIPRGQCLGFTPSARALWDQWYASIEQHDRASTEETAGAVARSHSHALRIMLLLAWDYGQARSGNDWYITEAELVPAIKITKLHLNSVRRIGENLAGSKDMRDRRIVLATVGLNSVSLGMVVTKSRLLLRRVKEVLESLCEEGVIKLATEPGKLGAWYRRPAPDEVEPEAYVPPVIVQPEGPGAKILPFRQSTSTGSSNITPASGGVFVPPSPAGTVAGGGMGYVGIRYDPDGSLTFGDPD